MPGGIGPINRQLALACSSVGVRGDAPASDDEREIFFNLSMGRAHYSPARERLYFAASLHLPIEGVLRAVMQGLGRTLSVRQLHLDRHGFFPAAHYVALPRNEAPVVLAALRLSGVRTTSAAIPCVASDADTR